MEEKKEEIKNEEVKQEGEFKIKKKPKKLTNQKKETPKITFKQQEDAVQTQETSTSDVIVEEKKDETSSPKVVEEIRDAEEVKKEVKEEKKEEIKESSTPVIEEITNTEEVEETKTVEEPKNNLPENVEKLINFMNETGGNLNDYVRLNADYSNVDDDVLLKEYYKNTKPHLDSEEINFIMEENFKVDEDYDEEREQRRKKLAKKEEVAKARNFLEDLKSKYYEEIKLRPTVNNEMSKASEFFNRHKKEQEVAKKQHEDFKNSTNKLFSEEFKGFDFALGEKKFRYSVSNPLEVAEAQSDISNIVKKFLNEKGEVVDFKGYHKAMYAARNADTIAQHFYEQGKADAVKDVVAKSKNINKDVRQTRQPEDIYLNGLKVKAISGMDSSKLKIKRK
jgi:hypothetical protein|tara:strand:- start:212 stop:1390 length:1179 start_codon:yes stop_codon:yes gene_type:complete